MWKQVLEAERETLQFHDKNGGLIYDGSYYLHVSHIRGIDMQEGRRFRQVDYAVIAVLYVGNIVDVWTGGWVTFTDDVLFGAEDDDREGLSPKKGNVRIQKADPISVLALGNSLLVLCMKCVLCLVLAFTADLRNRKFILYLLSLCLWFLTPIAGIVTTLTRSSALALSLSWLAAVLFVTSPLKYCLIFTQLLNPSRDQTRLVVALFEFMISSSTFLMHACFPSSRNFNASTVVTVWAAVIAPLGLVIILLTVAIRGHCSSERLKERSLEELSLGIRQDFTIKKDYADEIARRKKTALKRFIMFALLLCPVIAVTITLAAHEKVTRTLSKQVKLEKSWFEFTGALINLLAIPVITLVVSLSKGTRGTLWDYMVLACAHLLNTVIMLLIYLYFHCNDFSRDLLVPPSNQSEEPTWVTPITEEVPGKGVAVVYVYFHGDPRSKKYFFQSSLNENPKKVVYVRESVPVKESLKYDFSVWEEGGPRLNQTILVRQKERYFFVATGTTLKLTELVYVPDVKDFIPQNGACVIVVSSIAEGFGSVHAKKGVFSVSQQGKVIEFSPIPPTNSSIQWCVPAGNTTFSYAIQLTTRTRTVRNTVKLVPFKESLFMISWEPGLTMYGDIAMISYTTARYEVSDVVSKTETVLQATHGLEGLVAAAAKIGYVQFFWMGAPLRLRTTIFACVVVSNEIAAWLVDLLVEEIREKISLALFFLSFSAGLLHVVLGAIYDYKLPKNE